MVIFYLLFAGNSKDNSRPVTCVAKCCLKLVLHFPDDYFYEQSSSRKVIIFLSNFP
jgi:hypothetical protein